VTAPAREGARTIRVAEVGDADESRAIAERIAAADPGAQVYASPDYHAALARITGGRPVTLAASDDGGRSVGVMTYFERTDPSLGTVLNALPWFGSHGSPRVDPACGDPDGVAGALVGAFRARAAEPGVLSGTVVLSPMDDEARHGAVTAALEPDAALERVAQVGALPEPGGDFTERLLAGTFTQKTRNLARKALRQGFAIADEADRGDEAWAFLARTHRANMEAIGAIAKPREHLEALRAMPRGVRALFVAREGGRPVAALLVLRSGRVAEYFVPAVEAEARGRQPNTALIVRAMEWAAGSGCTAWNWGGTAPSLASLHHFKAGFGAADRRYAFLTVLGPGAGRALAGATPAALAGAFPGWFVAPYDLLARG
jgi:CelD/BcsL family acetyltransferase involved in cellulose biosynthesis